MHWGKAVSGLIEWDFQQGKPKASPSDSPTPFSERAASGRWVAVLLVGGRWTAFTIEHRNREAASLGRIANPLPRINDESWSKAESVLPVDVWSGVVVGGEAESHRRSRDRRPMPPNAADCRAPLAMPGRIPPHIQGPPQATVSYGAERTSSVAWQMNHET